MQIKLGHGRENDLGGVCVIFDDVIRPGREDL